MKKILDLAGEWLMWTENRGEEEAQPVMLPSTLAQEALRYEETGKILQGMKENEAKETGYLTERFPYSGTISYKKSIRIPANEAGLPMFLYLERTRISKVFVNDCEIGTNNSICAPHCYDVTEAVAKVANCGADAEQGNLVAKQVVSVAGKDDENQECVAIDLTIEVSNVGYPTGGGHMTSPDTQTNWIGILGRIELMVCEQADVISMTAEANRADGTVVLTLETVNQTASAVKKEISLDGAYVSLADWKAEQIEYVREAISFAEGTGKQTIEIQPGKGTCQITVKPAVKKEFSEFEPGYGEICIKNKEDDKVVSTVFGFRDFTTDRHHFYINGTKTFLRGKHDGMIFPLTGAAPMTVEGWLKVMRVSKSFGINHYRFHTCCPPDAAFYAADLLGIYMEPELPFWGTIADVGEEGFKEEEQNYLIAEGFRLMEGYGSHPSFAMMSLGNELWGSAKRLGSIIAGFKTKDRRHLYTSGSNNFQFYVTTVPEEDFFAGVRFDHDSLIRGSYAMCDAPQGFVQTDVPNTTHNYDKFFDQETSAEQQGGTVEIQYGTGTKKVEATRSNPFTTDKPVVSHEVGQYCTYPDYAEIEHYTGVLKPRNLEVFRERLEKAGMGDQAADFFRDSGALAAFCYKLELEAAHRSEMMAGYQLLDIQDFSGQGTALVGVLNALMEEKGTISKEDWTAFCGETVVMAQLPKFVYTQGEEIECKLTISHYGKEALKNCKLTMQIDPLDEALAEDAVLAEAAKKRAEGEDAVADAMLEFLQMKYYPEFAIDELENGVHNITELSYELPVSGRFEEYRLTLKLMEESGKVLARNTYPIYSYPETSSMAVEGSKVMAADMDTVAIRRMAKNNPEDVTDLVITSNQYKAKEVLKQGKRVLLLPEEIKEGVPGTYCTDFWCYPMFRSISESMNKPVPIGTLGLTIEKEHQALKMFGSHTHSTPQWYSIVSNSTGAILDGTAIKPIVQVIDNVERNHKLGLLFEAKCMGGNLLVCTGKLAQLPEDIAAKNLYHGLLSYALSEDFAPEEELLEEEYNKILA